MEPQLARVLNQRVLREMAGDSSFDHGERYFAGGQVYVLAAHKGTLIALKLPGTRPNSPVIMNPSARRTSRSGIS